MIMTETEECQVPTLIIYTSGQLFECVSTEIEIRTCVRIQGRNVKCVQVRVVKGGAMWVGIDQSGTKAVLPAKDRRLPTN